MLCLVAETDGGKEIKSWSETVIPIKTVACFQSSDFFHLLGNQMENSCLYLSSFSNVLSPSDALPEGLTHELPTADEFEKQPTPETTFNSVDDLDDLRRQLDALNAD